MTSFRALAAGSAPARSGSAKCRPHRAPDGVFLRSGGTGGPPGRGRCRRGAGGRQRGRRRPV